MIITSIDIERFGGLSDFQLELNDGIHVFYGDNGSGKSTLALFVRAMLYGVSSDRRKEEISLRSRILPLGSERAAGRLVLKTDNRLLEISRSFGKTRRSDRLVMTWLDDGTTPSTSQEPGEFFLDMNEATFSRTFFLGELGHAVLPGNVSQLNSRLMNLSVTGTEDMDYHQALKRLKEEERSLSSPRGAGSLDALLIKEAELKESLAEHKRLREDRDLLEVRLKEDIQEREKLKLEWKEVQEGLDSLEKLKELEDYEEAMILLARKKDLEKRIHQKGSPLPLAEVTELKLKLDGFLSRKADLSRKVAEHNEDSQKLEAKEHEFTEARDRLFHESNQGLIRDLSMRKVSHEARSSHLRKLNGDELKKLQNAIVTWQRLEKYERFTKQAALWLLPVPFLVYAIVQTVSTKNWMLLILGAVLLSLYGYLFFKGRSKISSLLADKKAGTFRVVEALIGPSGAKSLLNELVEWKSGSLTDVEDLWHKEYQVLKAESEALGLPLEDLEDYLLEQARYQAARKTWTDDLMTVEERFTQLKEELDTIKREEADLTERLLPAELMPDTAGRSELTRLESRMEIRSEEEQELSEIMNSLELMSLNRNLNPLLLEPERFRTGDMKSELDLKRGLKEKSDSLRDRLQGLEISIMRKEDQLKIMTETLKAIQPEAALQELQKEIAGKKRRKEILKLASEQLELSFLSIQRDYLPRVSKRVSELFKDLTDGVYSEVILTGDYRMKVKLNGEFVDMAYLSRGTMDLLWLGLRLALCDIITRGEKAPLIFDDSFIHLDGDRLTGILKVLDERIDGQIIILTCHHRESSLLKQLDRGH